VTKTAVGCRQLFAGSRAGGEVVWDIAAII
jgi:hypothetical protein